MQYKKIKRLKNGKFVVVMYHHISEAKSLFNSISFNEFKRQINYLSKHYNILSPEDFFIKFKKKKINKKDCILTFDDGYYSHYKYAFKYLTKKKIKAFFFPLINLRNMYGLHNINKIQLIINLIKKDFNKVALVQDILKRNNISISKILKKNFINKYQNIYYHKDVLALRLTLQRIFPYNLRTKIINKIYKRLINLKFRNYYCNIKHLKEIKSHGNEIGVHTLNHDWLSTISYRKQYKDISFSFNFLSKKKLINKKRWFFSYPFGDYNLNSLKVLKKKNCSMSFLAGDKFSNQSLSKLLIQRFDCNKIKNIL
jgi:peptidoglycan/xylan/chitin deacetylase (PgdA/CDA1 family)